MDIPKRYDAAIAEPKWQHYWEEKKIYNYDPDRKAEVFSVDTPPPYVSAAHLHVGHAMSYTQAEIIVRYKRMRGFSIFYPMGFDDNGLPTERFVETKHKIDKSKISRSDFIKLCLEETRLGGETYMTLWKSLGLSVDWRTLYSTINPRCRAISQRSFLDLYAKLRIVRRDDPINWCPFCQTALAQADIEIEEEETWLSTIRFQAVGSGDDLLIATTRPELIPGCVAIYVNPDDKRYSHLVGKRAKVAYSGQEVPIKTDPAVAIEYGTGLMMVCTWGDAEDVRKWKEHKLDTRVAIRPDGTMSELAASLEGKTIKDARKAIVEILEQAGLLVKKEKLLHQVGVHERCHSVVEFNHAPQWFIRVLDLKEELLARGRELNWYPEYFRLQYENWVEGLKWDWCISRQRYYGVPFPVWFCNDCAAVMTAKDEDLPVDPMVDQPRENCRSCGGSSFRGEGDVMDTWMTSSLTPMINANWGQPDDRMAGIFPMTVRVQAFEIIRTWLFYTMVKAHLHNDSLPFKEAMISGWGLDKSGKKMSKRLGNFVTPEDMIGKYSADALRYWSASAHLGANLNFSEEEVAAGNKLLNKLWNASKFIHSHLADFDKFTANDRSIVNNLNKIDRGVLSKLHLVVSTAGANLDKYEFSKAKTEIERFFWMDLCDNYLEIVKDILYKPEEYGLERRKAAQWTLFNLHDTMLRLFAPFIPHICEELFHLFTRVDETSPSIHLESWPEAWFKDEDAERVFNRVCEIVQCSRRQKTAENTALNTTGRLYYTAALIDGVDKGTLIGPIPDITSATRLKVIFQQRSDSLDLSRYQRLSAEPEVYIKIDLDQTKK